MGHPSPFAVPIYGLSLPLYLCSRLNDSSILPLATVQIHEVPAGLSYGMRRLAAEVLR